MPIDNFLQPDVAGKALSALNDAIVEQAGRNIGLLYDGPVYEALRNLERDPERIESQSHMSEGPEQPEQTPAFLSSLPLRLTKG